MAREPDDYVKVAKQYARAAIRDKKRSRHGVLIRAAAQRFIDDLARARKRGSPFIFDRDHANDACDFIEKMPHVEGKWDSPTIIMHPSHVFFVVQLFGFRQREATDIDIELGGEVRKFRPRRFTSALFAVARKNAKSTLAACIMNYCMCCEPEEGAQLYSAATTGDQASIIFKTSKAMIDKEPDLREWYGLETWSRAVTRVEVNATYKALNAKASTQDGLNPSHVAMDEIHAHKTADLLNVLTSAAGGRGNPLWLYTTTEGYINAGPWSDLRVFARNLLTGVFDDLADHFLVSFYALDEKDEANGIEADEEFDESKWVKANPLMDVNPYLKEAIRKDAIEAKQMPSKLAEFRIKRLNRQASTAAGFINLMRWKECGGAVDLERLREYPCWGGLDLAQNRDLNSFRLIWDIDGVIHTVGWRWVPEEAVEYRTERGTVPYAGWVEKGHLKQTEGDVTDYDVIEADLLEIWEQFDIQMIAYDRWNALDLVNRLVKQELPLIEFVQGPKSYHPAMQELERRYLSRKLLHGGDPVLNWCASNLVARRDVNLNMAPDKGRSADKIDDMAALLMAVGVSMSAEPEEDQDKAMEDYLKHYAQA